MTAIPGTNVASRIVPFDTADTFATHLDKYGRGGYRVVADISERDSITEPRQKEGMLVYVVSTQETYRLDSSATPPLSSSNWSLVSDPNSIGLQAAYNTGNTIDITGDDLTISGPGEVLIDTYVTIDDNLEVTGDLIIDDISADVIIYNTGIINTQNRYYGTVAGTPTSGDTAFVDYEIINDDSGNLRIDKLTYSDADNRSSNKEYLNILKVQGGVPKPSGEYDFTNILTNSGTRLLDSQNYRNWNLTSNQFSNDENNLTLSSFGGASTWYNVPSSADVTSERGLGAYFSGVGKEANATVKVYVPGTVLTLDADVVMAYSNYSSTVHTESNYRYGEVRFSLDGESGTIDGVVDNIGITSFTWYNPSTAPTSANIDHVSYQWSGLTPGEYTLRMRWSTSTKFSPPYGGLSNDDKKNANVAVYNLVTNSEYPTTDSQGISTPNVYLSSLTPANSGNILTWDSTGKLVDAGVLATDTYVQKTGDTMTGPLNINNDGSTALAITGGTNGIPAIRVDVFENSSEVFHGYNQNGNKVFEMNTVGGGQPRFNVYKDGGGGALTVADTQIGFGAPLLTAFDIDIVTGNSSDLDAFTMTSTDGGLIGMQFRDAADGLVQSIYKDSANDLVFYDDRAGAEKMRFDFNEIDVTGSLIVNLDNDTEELEIRSTVQYHGAALRLNNFSATGTDGYAELTWAHNTSDYFGMYSYQGYLAIFDYETNTDVIQISGDEGTTNTVTIGTDYPVDVTIKSLEGSADGIITVDANGKLVNSGLTIADISGGGAVSVSAGAYQGIEECNTVNDVYTISHASVDINKSYPQVSLTIPSSGSSLYLNGITNRTSTSFDVVLSAVPSVSGYGINWLLIENAVAATEFEEITVNGDVNASDTSAFYMGDENTDGTWRIIRSGNNLEFQRRESSSWVTKSSMTP